MLVAMLLRLDEYTGPRRATCTHDPPRRHRDRRRPGRARHRPPPRPAGPALHLLEAADGPAAAWRSRWDSLALFIPAATTASPGRAFPGDPDHYPTRDEVVAYLTEYVRHFALPVEYDSPSGPCAATATATSSTLEDRTATAPPRSWSPPARSRRRARPRSPSGSPPTIVQLHSCGLPLARRRSRPVRCWSSAAATPASRSPRSSARSDEVTSPIGARQRGCPQRPLGRRHLHLPPSPPG